MDTAVGTQATREKQNNFCKTNLTHKIPTLNLGRGSGESSSYAVIWFFSVNTGSVREKGGAGGSISWPWPYAWLLTSGLLASAFLARPLDGSTA